MDTSNLDLVNTHLSSQDRRIRLLITGMGLEGFAIYVILFEILTEAKDHNLPYDALPSISAMYSTKLSKVEHVIKDYYLFQLLGDHFGILYN